MGEQDFSRLLTQFARLGDEGAFGPEAQVSGQEYVALPNDVSRAAKYLIDFYSERDDVSEARDYMVQSLLVIYRDASKVDVSVAKAFANGFVADFPDTNGTALLPRWTELAHACFGFKATSTSNNPSAVWQQSSLLILRMNEFLDGLMGLMLLAWRCAQGKKLSPGVLGNAYGSKVDEFAQLTGGENGAFYLFFRLARPVLRNSLAHGDAWLDIEGGVVRYRDRAKNELVLDTAEFLMVAKLGCDLARSYIAFLAVVILLATDNQAARSLIPTHLLGVLSK